MNLKSNVMYLDTTRLKCPILFVKTKQWLKKLRSGQSLLVLVKDSSGIKDIKNYLDKHSYQYSLSTQDDGVVEFRIWGLNQHV